jgi:hypothetical protein
LEPLAATSPDAILPIHGDPDWMRTFDATLAEARRVFDRAWLSERGEPWALSDGVLNLNACTSQINVGFQTWDQHARDSVTTLEPAMACLATSAVEDGIGLFSRLECPRACEFAEMNGPLRMVVDYDIRVDAYITRFDVRGATTEAGTRYANGKQAARTKRRLLSSRGLALSVLRLPR